MIFINKDMLTTDKTLIKERFKEIFETLKKENKISGVGDFAIKCDYNQSSISMILTGDRFVPTKLLHTMCDKFGINKAYLFDGQGDMFIVAESVIINPKGNLEVEIRLLRMQVEGLEAIKNVLLEQKAELKERNDELKEIVNNYKKSENLTSKAKGKG